MRIDLRTPARRGAVLLLGLLAVSCGGESNDARAGGAAALPSPSWHGPPVLIVGVDGLEWTLFERLIAEGRMPHCQALAERGVAGKLLTFVPTFSPIVWTSIATGVSPRTHGILNFLQYPDPQDESTHLPYTSNCRAVPALWNVAAENGREVLSVAWWVSWPAEPVPHGRIVASYAAQAQAQILWKPLAWEDGLPELTWPPELAEEIGPALAAGAPDGDLGREFDAVFGEPLPGDDGWRFPRNRDGLFRSVYRGDRTHLRIMLEQLDAGLADLNMVYVGLPDVAGHFFWRYHEPEAFEYEIPEEQIARLGSRVMDSYVELDDWVGKLLARMPEEAHVMVLSDHGMHAVNPADPRMIQSGGHDDAPPGVLIMAGPSVAVQGVLPVGTRKLGTVYDVFPTVLDWLEIPVPRDGDGAPMRGAFTQGWKDAHPIATVPSYREGYREPTPPEVPGEGLNEVFEENILNELGYGGLAEPSSEAQGGDGSGGIDGEVQGQ